MSNEEPFKRVAEGPHKEILHDWGEDLLARKPFAEGIFGHIEQHAPYTEGSYVVSLEGGYGSGKSSFLAMWNDELQERRKSDESLPLSIVLNVWESDHSEDPMLAMMATLLEVLDQHAVLKEDRESLENAAKNLSWFVGGLVNEFVASWSGVNIHNAAQLAEEKQAERRAQHPLSPLKVYQERAKAVRVFKAALRNVIENNGIKILFLVDELDRCRPDYAIRYLEALKHIYDIHGLLFVLAYDRQALESSAKSLYGQDMDVGGYLNRFIHRTYQLKHPGKQLAEYISKLNQHYLTYHKDDKVANAFDIHHPHSWFHGIFREAHISLRHWHHIFRILNDILDSKSDKLRFVYSLSAFFLLKAKFTNEALYSRLVSGEPLADEDCRYIIELESDLKIGAELLCFVLVARKIRSSNESVDVRQQTRETYNRLYPENAVPDNYDFSSLTQGVDFRAPKGMISIFKVLDEKISHGTWPW